MSDQLNFDQDAQPRLRLAAQTERPQAAAAKPRARAGTPRSDSCPRTLPRSPRRTCWTT